MGNLAAGIDWAILSFKRSTTRLSRSPLFTRALTKQYMPHSMKSSLGIRLGANRHVISLSATAAIEKVFQAHYLQYKTYCIRVKRTICTSDTTAYIVVVYKLRLMGARLCKL